MMDARYKLKNCLNYNDTLTEIKKESLEFLAEYICKINDTYNKLVDKIINLQQENQKLKEELEDMTLCRDIASGHRQEVQDRETLLLRYQERFIKYLEDEIQQQETAIAGNQEKLYLFKYEDEKDDLKLSSQKAYIKRVILEEILKEYKSIIGVK